ncbi:hypothetical protein SAY87_012529 [Trapa incisa]|uniref:Uncharacterized protein n=1 Tax=Trapa incisa TaxID=236973 RepID=A0AAN7H183_9MYRT|nr:hypothetical protein SAY87_012529 [Trapa incisa]
MDISHIRRRKRLTNEDTASEDHDQDEEDEGLSTSEDAMNEQKMEPEFDLLKSMLRKSYSKSKIVRQDEKVPREKNIEVEVVSASKHKRKMNTIIGGDAKSEGKVKVIDSTADDSAFTVERELEPRFRDFGEMG